MFDSFQLVRFVLVGYFHHNAKQHFVDTFESFFQDSLHDPADAGVVDEDRGIEIKTKYSHDLVSD